MRPDSCIPKRQRKLVLGYGGGERERCIPPLLPGSRRGGKAIGDQRQLSSIEMFYFVLAFFLKHPLFSNNKSYSQAKTL